MGRNLFKEYGLEHFFGEGIYYQDDEADDMVNLEEDTKQCRIFANQLWECQNAKRQQLGGEPLKYAKEMEEVNETFLRQLVYQMSGTSSAEPKTIMIIKNQSGDHQIAILCVRDDSPEPSKAVDEWYGVVDCRQILENSEYQSGVISVCYDRTEEKQYYLARFLK